MAIHPTSKKHAFHVPAALHPLTEKQFRMLWAGAFLSNIGFWIQSVAQGWQVLLLTNSALLLGLVSFMAMLPNLLLSIFGGVVVDKFDRRSLLLVTQSIYMATALLLGVLTTLHVITVWYIILLALVNGTFSAVGFPAWQTFITDLVQDGELKQGIALNSMQFNLSRVVGPALGGLSISIFGIAGSYYMNGISYVAVLIPLLVMHPRQKERLTKMQQSIWSNLAEGLLYLKKRPVLQVALGLQLMIAFFVFPYATLLPVFARDIFHTGPAGLGILNAVAGVGALLGSILLVMLTERLRHGVSALFLFCLCGGTASIIFTWIHMQAFAQPLLIPLGASAVIATTLTNTIIQSSTPEEMRGRVISIWITITFGVAPFGNLLAGLVAQIYGAPLTLALGGLLCITVATALVLLTRNVLRPHMVTQSKRA